MEIRTIGSLKVPAVGLGCNNFGMRIDEAATQAVVEAALDEGVNFFDTANIYGGGGKSEELLAPVLSRRRNDIVLASKFGMKMPDGRLGGRPEYAREMLHDSLRRLGVDHIDLYYLHQPDPEVPLADTLGAMQDMVREGLVREIACSNFSVEMLEEAKALAGDGPRFVAVQNHYSLLHRAPEDDGVLAWCGANDTALIPFYPLHNGALTGKYRQGQERPQGARLSTGPRGDQLLTDETLDLVEELINFTESRGRTLLELAFGWLLSHDAVASVIAGATKPKQIRGNVAASGWRLSEAERDSVYSILSAASR